jgi:single-strand DNA-binding protein
MYWQNINRVTIGGNICNDLKLRDIKGGKSDTKVVDFSIANNLKSSDNQNSKAHFYRCEAWGKTAETICNFFKKGDPITIDGTLHHSKWTHKDTKEDVETITIRVESFFFPPTRKSGKPENSEPRVPGNFPPPIPTTGDAPILYSSQTAIDDKDDIPF